MVTPKQCKLWAIGVCETSGAHDTRHFTAFLNASTRIANIIRQENQKNGIESDANLKNRKTKI